ncbi:hypothetical protein [Streptomyces sp. Caat 7-52]|uniref:hypothetical protein n=1 Tax=Streptomyces sp. Caat 7-52 TaxID=2949637 RepID=UPI002034EFD8|nr:hypothetical protein [Streptomyces sp. Caat 7-52]
MKSWDQVLDEFAAEEARREHDHVESAGLAGLAERLQAVLGQAALTPRPAGS